MRFNHCSAVRGFDALSFIVLDTFLGIVQLTSLSALNMFFIAHFQHISSPSFAVSQTCHVYKPCFFMIFCTFKYYLVACACLLVNQKMCVLFYNQFGTFLTSHAYCACVFNVFCVEFQPKGLKQGLGPPRAAKQCVFGKIVLFYTTCKGHEHLCTLFSHIPECLQKKSQPPQTSLSPPNT